MDIDELVVKLVLDPRGIREGTKEAEDIFRKFRGSVKAGADDTERQADKMVQGFSRVTKELLGLGAVMLGLGGLKEMVTSTIDRAGGTGMAGTIFGINPEQLSKFENAMEQAGVSVETTRASVGALATDIARLVHMGQGSLLQGNQALAQLGITELDRDPIKFAMKVHEALMKNPNILKEPGLANLIASQVQGLQPMLGGLANPGLQEFLASAQYTTQAQAQAARDLSAAGTQLQQAATSIKNSMMENVAPTAIEAMKATTEWIKGLQSGKNEIPGAEGILGGDPFGAAGDIGTALGGNMNEARRLLYGLIFTPEAAKRRLSPYEIGAPAPPGMVAPGFDPMSDYSTSISPYGGIPYSGHLSRIIEEQGRRIPNQFVSPSTGSSITVNAPVNITTSSNDPRTFGGMVAMSLSSELKRALPSIAGATR